MAHSNLRQALQTAGIQPDELADILQVDQRTVRRWLAGGTPYARHRAQISRALDTTEPALWPHLTIPQTNHSKAAIADTVTAYPDPSESEAPTIEDLVAAAREQIDLTDDYRRLVVRAPALLELVLAKARGGCRIRILVSMPDPSLVPLIGEPGIQIRLSDGDERPITHRVDDGILTCLDFPATQDQPAVLLHAARDRAPGLFTLLVNHYQQGWEHADPIDTADDIDHFLTEHDVDDDTNQDADDDDWTPERGRAGSDSHSALRSEAEARQPNPLPPSSGATPPRRWPGRPG